MTGVVNGEDEAGLYGLGLDIGVNTDGGSREFDKRDLNSDESPVKNGRRKATASESSRGDIYDSRTGNNRRDMGNGRVMAELVNGEKGRGGSGNENSGDSEDADYKRKRNHLNDYSLNRRTENHSNGKGNEKKKEKNSSRIERERTTVHSIDKGSSVAGATLTDLNDLLYDSPPPTPQQPPSPDSPRQTKDNYKVQKLSPARLHELTSSPDSLCLHTLRPDHPAGRKRSEPQISTTLEAQEPFLFPSRPEYVDFDTDMGVVSNGVAWKGRDSRRRKSSSGKPAYLENSPELFGRRYMLQNSPARRRDSAQTPRTVSTPDSSRRRQTVNDAGNFERQSQTWTGRSRPDRRMPARLNLDTGKFGQASSPSISGGGIARSGSPVPASMPIPPFSIPTYLQLELSSDRPSPLYIHRPPAREFPYESSRVKLERLQNFFLLPPLLEQVLLFGALACFDAWLYSFTILPMRFCKAIVLLVHSWIINLGLETKFIISYVVKGLGRMWERRHGGGGGASINGTVSKDDAVSSPPLVSAKPTPTFAVDVKNRSESNRPRRASASRRHRRNRSIPSNLLPDDKADILKGLLMISTCMILMRFDASRMYHWIRGQAAIKLYVIYNVLEVSCSRKTTLFVVSANDKTLGR